MKPLLPPLRSSTLLQGELPALGGGCAAVLLQDSLDAVLQAWVLGELLRGQGHIRVYCSPRFHAYFEQADWVQSCEDVSALFPQRSTWLGQTRVQPSNLAAGGVEHLITVGQGPWLDDELWPALGEGLQSAAAYPVELSHLTQPLRAQWPQLRVLAAGPQGLARPTYHYRSLSPQSLKLVVVLSPERWLQEPSAPSDAELGAMNTWIKEQTEIARRLKLSVTVTRLCLNPGQRLQSRALTEQHRSVLLISSAELLGHVSYADALLSDLPELTRLAECMGKSSPSLL